MKILLVGSGSVIARAISRRLHSFAEVQFAGRTGATYLLDLTQPALLPSIREHFDVVVNCAADFGGPSDVDFIRSEVVNSAGALAVCALAHRAGAKHVVHLSSTSATYREGNPLFGIYALSKRHGEESAALFCSEMGMALTILRPTQVYDAEGACRRHQKLLYGIADRAQAGEDVCLYGTNDARRNYLFLDDLAEVCERVIQRGVHGEFTVGHPREVKLSEVAAAALGAFGKGGKVRFLPDQPDIPDLPELGELDLYNLIDYHPATDLNKGMELIRESRERQA